MFNPQIITSGFKGLVGFRQQLNPQYPQIKDSLIGSESGYLIQEAHPLCDMENIISSAPDFSDTVYPAWSAASTYRAGQVVSHSDKVYKSKVAITGNAANSAPDLATASWELTSPFSEWLEGVYDQSCIDLCNALVQQKKLQNLSKSVVDSMKLYEGAGATFDRIIKKGRFCALRITLQPQENMVIKIDKLGFQFDTQETINFYLYHSSQQAPLKVIEVDFSKAGSFQWFELPGITLESDSMDHDAGGAFYLGYYESDLQGQVIEKKFDMERPCHSCGGYNLQAFNQWTKLMKVQTIYVDQNDLPGDKTMFDEDMAWITKNTNFGFNLSITAKCDASNFFVKHRELFADALNKQIALNFIKKIAFSTRINAIADKTKAYAQGELDNKEGVSSFINDLKDAVKTLNFDFSGFSSDCLPCVNRRGVTVGAR